MDAGSQQAVEVGGLMQEARTSISRVSEIVTEIAAASDEQTRGIEQVNVAVAEIDEVAQRNAAVVQEATANSLQEQADLLRNKVSTFKLQ